MTLSLHYYVHEEHLVLQYRKPENTPLKPPRVIDIPEPLHATILRKFDRAKWPEDRIGEVGGAMLTSIEKHASEIEDRMWSIIRKNLPEDLADASAGSLRFDYKNLVIHRIDESGERVGDSYSLPEIAAHEAEELAIEAEITRNSAKLVGIACMGIAEEAERSMRAIYRLVQKHVPECSVGNWVINVRTMKMQEQVTEPPVREDGPGDDQQGGSDPSSL